MNYGIASYSSWSKSTCNLKTGITRIRGFLKTDLSLQRCSPLKGRKQAGLHSSPLKGQSPQVLTWLVENIQFTPIPPLMIGWTTGGRMHQKSSVEKTTRKLLVFHSYFFKPYFNVKIKTTESSPIQAQSRAFLGSTLEFPWDPS